MDMTDWTPTIPRRAISAIVMTRPRFVFPTKEIDTPSLYEGVHAKTGKRYSLRATTIVGELPQTPEPE